MPVTVRRTDYRPTVCFTFIDEGHRTIAKFERFLRTHDRLLCSLIDFAVIYVATIPRNFEHAQRLFERRFPATIVPQLPGSSSRSAQQGSEGAPDIWLEVRPFAAQGLDGLAVGDDVIILTWLHRARRDVLLESTSRVAKCR